MSDLEDAIKKIRLVILDVDGVLTDGTLLSDMNGNETKSFHVHDGAGIAYLHLAGLKTAVITGRHSKAVQKRAAELGIEEVYQGEMDKVKCYERILDRLGLGDEAASFMGDDLHDLPVMLRVGLPIAPANAREEVKNRALYVTEASGGNGAVREAVELILKTQGRWDTVLQKFLNDV